MHSARKRQLAAIGITLAALLPVAASAAESGEEIIKKRINFMDEEVYGEFKVLAGFVRGGKSSLADVEKSAKNLASLAKKIPAHFPKDTGRGKYPDTMTRALPVIWQDWPRFEKEIQRLADGSERLARAAAAGDKDTVVELIGPQGNYSRTKIGCVECHEAFRGERVKK